MALQVWLPLNGNLDSQGVSDLMFNNTNTIYTTIVADGKIGKCYHNASNSVGGIISDKKILLGQNQSMFCWLKLDNFYNDSKLNGILGQHSYSENSGMGITIKTLTSTTGYLSVNTGNGTDRTFNTYCGETLLNANVWYHVGYTYDGKTIKLYVNGLLDGKYNYTDMYVPENYIGVFAWSIWGNGIFGNYILNGSLNDVRIYDHTLSEKEIKLISQGLVIHYPLNQKIPRTNLVKNSIYQIYNNYKAPSTLTKLDENFQGCDVYRLTQTPDEASLAHFQANLSSHGVYGFNRIFKANTKYCFWIYYRSVTHQNVRVGGTASNISGWTGIPSQYYRDGWYRVGQYRNGTVTVDKDDAIFTSWCLSTAKAGEPVSIDFCCPHLVEGIDYIVEEDDYQVDSFDGVVRDTSGYKYDGEVCDTVPNTAALSNDSPRYDGSMFFDKTYISLNNPIHTSATEFTISCWAKFTNSTSTETLYTARTSVGNGIAVFKIGNKIRFDDNAQWTSIYTLPTNEWVLISLTRDSKSKKLYINGKLVDSANTIGNMQNIGSYGTIGGSESEDTGIASGNWLSGNISDFRIYGTALSAEDIKSLYEVSASVTNNGVLMTSGEVVEHG